MLNMISHSQLGPLLFHVYGFELVGVINQYIISVHQYADNTQLYFHLQQMATNQLAHCWTAQRALSSTLSCNYVKTQTFVIRNSSVPCLTQDL